MAAAGLVGLLPLGCFWCDGQMVQALVPAAVPFAAVVLLTNLLTAANLTRMFRSLFLGAAMPKTRRTPEVNWLMALPMVRLTVVVLLTPLLMQRIDPVPGIAAFSLPARPRADPLPTMDAGSAPGAGGDLRQANRAHAQAWAERLAVARTDCLGVEPPPVLA